MFVFQQIIRNESCTAGYVQLEVDNPEKTVSMNMPMYGLVPNLMKLLKHSNENDKYLFMPNNLRKWMNSVADKALKDLKTNLHAFGILDVST